MAKKILIDGMLNQGQGNSIVKSFTDSSQFLFGEHYESKYVIGSEVKWVTYTEDMLKFVQELHCSEQLDCVMIIDPLLDTGVLEDYTGIKFIRATDLLADACVDDAVTKLQILGAKNVQTNVAIRNRLAFRGIDVCPADACSLAELHELLHKVAHSDNAEYNVILAAQLFGVVMYLEDKEQINGFVTVSEDLQKILQRYLPESCTEQLCSRFYSFFDLQMKYLKTRDAQAALAAKM